MKRPAKKKATRKGTPPQAPVIPTPQVIRGGALSASRERNLPPPEFPEVADPKKRAYLVQLSITGRFDDAASAAGVSMRTGWNWRFGVRGGKPDEAFVEAVDVARGFAGDRMEAEVMRRAFDGVEEPVYQGGRMVGTVRKFSDVLAIFALKGAMPEKYRERYEHTGKDGGPIEVTTNVRASLAGKIARLAGA